MSLGLFFVNYNRHRSYIDPARCPCNKKPLRDTHMLFIQQYIRCAWALRALMHQFACTLKVWNPSPVYRIQLCDRRVGVIFVFYMIISCCWKLICRKNDEKTVKAQGLSEEYVDKNINIFRHVYCSSMLRSYYWDMMFLETARGQ